MWILRDSYLGSTNRCCLVISIVAVIASTCGSSSLGSLIENGDFESGNTGFTSEYQYVPPLPPPGRIGFAEYTVFTDPADVHDLWASFGDHTTGAGNMMIVNGKADITAWSQEVDLVAGTTYGFSAWATGVYPLAPARLEFLVGGTSLGTLQVSAALPDWKEFSAEFTATATGPTAFTIRDLEGASSGNDFALDDISLQALSSVPEPETLLTWLLLSVIALAYRKTLRFSSIL